MTPGQIWVKRRLKDLIKAVEEAATTHVDIENYKNFNFKEYSIDVYNAALDIVVNTEIKDWWNMYDSIISTMEDTFNTQLKKYYESEIGLESLNESFDRILDLYKKVKEGGNLKPSEKSMMNAFKMFVDKGGNAEDFEYSDEEDYDVDEREGEKFKWEKWGKPLVFTFSEENEENGEIEYFGEITFNGDEFLGVISTDKRGYITDYDFYSVFDENVRLQDTLREMGIEAEIMNFFAEEIIPILRR
jgi:hypothetical protein